MIKNNEVGSDSIRKLSDNYLNSILDTNGNCINCKKECNFEVKLQIPPQNLVIYLNREIESCNRDIVLEDQIKISEYFYILVCVVYKIKNSKNEYKTLVRERDGSWTSYGREKEREKAIENNGESYIVVYSLNKPKETEANQLASFFKKRNYQEQGPYCYSGKGEYYYVIPKDNDIFNTRVK